MASRATRTWAKRCSTSRAFGAIPDSPNLRQVHLIHAELHDELRAKGFHVEAGAMGENITTRGIDLLGLPVNARLHLGADAIVEVKGLRNPCAQLDGLAEGPDGRDARTRTSNGNLIRKAGIMGDRDRKRRGEARRRDSHRTARRAARDSLRRFELSFDSSG